MRSYPLLFSLRLTAYVVKVFSMANTLVDVPKLIICSAVNFLLTAAQKGDGSFKEVGKFYNYAMNVSAMINPPTRYASIIYSMNMLLLVM